MKISELIRKLEAIQATEGDLEVMILDGFNGGGVPRDINLGPSLRLISEYDAHETGDCENRVGEHIVRIGYGCY